jgi:hypothetical protein
MHFTLAATTTRLSGVKLGSSGAVGQTLPTGVDGLVTELSPKFVSLLYASGNICKLTRFGGAGCTLNMRQLSVSVILGCLLTGHSLRSAWSTGLDLTNIVSYSVWKGQS